MMPFYGATPDEAARLLAKWLTLAHGARKDAAQKEVTIGPAAQDTGRLLT
jgi:hypothetical protein